MKTLQDIKKLKADARELLEAAGYFDVDSLKEHGLAQITDELVKANNVLEIVKQTPTVESVKKWLEPIQDEVGEIVDDTPVISPEMLVDEKDLLSASFAIPISSQFLEKNDVSVTELLTGNVKFTSEEAASVNHERLSAKSNTAVVEEIKEEQNNKAKGIKSQPRNVLEKVDEILTEVRESKTDDPLDGLFEDSVFSDRKDARIDKEKIISMDTFREEGSRIAPLENAGSDDLTRATRKETNAGVSPDSRRYIRGVLHKRMLEFKFGVFAFFFFIFCIVAGIVLTPLVLLDEQKYWWSIWCPLLFVVGLLFYLMFTGKAQCPICNQKQFAPKRCLKHRNAHRLPIVGYMLPTALHAFFYKWFRCIFCGTSVRLKE